MNDHFPSRPGPARAALLAVALTLGSAPTFATPQLVDTGQVLVKPTTNFTNTQFFGRSVDADGDYLVVGSQEATGAEIDIFRWSGSQWFPWQRLDTTVAGSLSVMGFASQPRSVCLRGDTLVVGGGVGAVLVFIQDTAGKWALSQTLTPPPFSSVFTGAFGHSVDFDDRWLVVGAHLTDYTGTGANEEGAVYVFEQQGGQWQSAPTPLLAHPDLLATPPKLTPNRKFGLSVALHAGRLFVGAPGDRTTGSSGIPVAIGRVVGFDLDSSNPQQSARLHGAPSPAVNGEFGYALGFDGGTLAIGEPGYAPGGRAYLASWNQNLLGTPVDTGLTAAPGSRLGQEIRVDGPRAVVGSGGNATDLAWELLQTSQGQLVVQLRKSAGAFGTGSFGSSLAMSARGVFSGAKDSIVPPFSFGGSGALWFFDRNSAVDHFCDAPPNSTGQAASLTPTGLLSVAANDLTFLLANAPPNQLAAARYSKNPAVNPFTGSGCLTKFAKNVKPLMLLGPSGSAATSPDLQGPPMNGIIQPGSSWHFQAVFRDQGSLGYSDGKRITFTF